MYHPVDVYAGGRLRLRRTLLGMSQTDLASQVKLTFQQVQKYENGSNRISASRLYEFSKILQVPIQFFFDGFGEDTPQPEISRETMEFMKNYSSIPSVEIRTKIRSLVRSVAE